MKLVQEICGRQTN